jgi:hypothetical protein
MRREVFERAKGVCEYCKSQAGYATEPFAADHIIPRSKGGQTILENLALACAGCNGRKYTKTFARDPQSGKRVRLYNPCRQKWSRHFEWSDDFTLIMGRTRCGRATIEALKLNPPPLIALRRVLYQAGEHPPQ